MHEPQTGPSRFDPAFLFLIASLAAIGPFSIDLYLPAFGAISEDLSARPDQVQTTLSAYFIGLAAGQVVVGPLSDRFGRRWPLLAGLILYVVASLGCAMAGSVEALTAWRMLQAGGACAGIVSSRAILRDLFGPQDMARALSMVMLVMGLAPIVAPLIGAVVHEALGWRSLFLALAVYGGGVALAVALRLDETLATPVHRTPREVVSGYVDLFRERELVGYAVAGGLAQAGMFVYIASSSFVFVDVYGLSSAAFAMVFALNATGLIAASQLNERLLRRTDPQSLVPKAFAVQGVASLVLVAAASTGFGGVVGVAIPLFVSIASLGFTFPNTTAAAMSSVGDRAGLASALLGTFQFGIAGIASFAAGQLYDESALPMAFVMASFSMASILAYWGLVPSPTGPTGAVNGAYDRS